MIKEHKEFGEKLNDPEFCKRIDDESKFSPSDTIRSIDYFNLSESYAFVDQRY